MKGNWRPAAPGCQQDRRTSHSMQFSVITQLVQTQPLPRLQAAEQALLAGQKPPFAVAGRDAAERLTHVLVAQVLLAYMREHNADLPAARRAFARRVRAWVSPE